MNKTDLVKATTYSSAFEGIGNVPNLSRVSGNNTGLRDIILDSSAQLVLPPVIPVMIQLPEFYLENDPGMANAIELILTHLPTEITGIDINPTLASHDGPESRTGQTVATVGMQKLDKPSPNFSIPEIYRSLVWRVAHQWREDMSALGTGVFGARFSNPGECVPSRYSVAMAFIQPDQTYLPENIIDGQLIAGMFPLDIGELGLQKNNDHNAPSRTITTTGYSLWTPTLRKYMVEVAKQVDITRYRKLSTTATTPVTLDSLSTNTGVGKILTDILK